MGWWLWTWAWGLGALAAPLEQLEQAVGEVAERWVSERPDAPEALDDWYAAALQRADDPPSTAFVRWAIAEACRNHDLPQEALNQYEVGLVGLRGGAVGTERLTPDAAREVFDPGVKGFTGGSAVPVELWYVDPASRSDWVSTDAGTSAMEVALLLGAGNLYLAQGQFDAARVPLNDAIEKADLVGDPVLRVGVRTGTAWLALRNGRPREAVAIFEAIDARALPRGPRVAVRGAWTAAGLAQLEAGNLEEARRLLDEAESLYDAVDDPSGSATLLVAQGRLAEALEKSGRAARRYRAAAAMAPPGADAAWAAAAGQARLREAQGDWMGALEAWSRYLDAVEAQANGFLTDEGRFTTVETQAENLDRMVAIAVAHAEASGDAALAHRVMARARRRSLPALLAERRDLEPRTAGVMPRDEIDVPSMAVQMAVGVSRPSGFGDRQLDLGALPESDELFPTVAPPSGTWSISYYALPEQLIVSVRNPDGGVRLGSTQITRRTLHERVIAFRQAIGADGDTIRGLERLAPRPAESADLAGELYTTLLGPVRAFLPPSDTPLLVVPDATLWSLPFASLQDAEGQWFGDRVLHFGISEGAVARSAARERPRRDKALIVGNPGKGVVQTCGETATLSALPGAQAEAEAIATLYGSGADLLVGDQADALRLEAWHPGYGVLHFATHGYACGRDPLDSIVQLGVPDTDSWLRENGSWIRRDDPRLPVRVVPPDAADELPSVRGELTARRVMTRWQLEADLVALSACETGLGRASHEGTIGLLRAFVASGARSVLASLWPVDDEATRELMVAFYRGYRDHGDKALALRDAMATTRERFAEPRQWSGFVLVGPTE